jgi:hypothetical protein
MSGWLANSLASHYERALVGFDFRLPKIPALQPLKISNPRDSEKALKAATLDPELWKTSELGDYDFERNGINFMDQATAELYDARVPPKVALVAFDIPDTLFAQLEETFGLRALDAKRVFLNPNWRFLGFDIADIRTQSSALYSFDLTETEQNKLREAVPFPLNEWGLVNQESDAIATCTKFDDVIHAHAPFAPCGVWMARSS